MTRNGDERTLCCCFFFGLVCRNYIKGWVSDITVPGGCASVMKDVIPFPFRAYTSMRILLLRRSSANIKAKAERIPTSQWAQRTAEGRGATNESPVRCHSGSSQDGSAGRYYRNLSTLALAHACHISVLSGWLCHVLLLGGWETQPETGNPSLRASFAPK